MRKIPVFSGGALLLAAVTAAAIAQSRVRIVTFSLVEHQVQVSRPPSPGWTPAFQSAPVVEGERIRTLANGVAEVELECGSALRLTPGSELVFNRLRLSRAGLAVTAVTLTGGEAFLSMQDGDSRDFQVQLPGAVLSLPQGGARLRLDVSAHQSASFEVLHGRIQLAAAGGKPVTVKSSHRMELLPGGGYHALALAKADTWQKWSHHRDQLFTRAVWESRSQPPAATTGLVPWPTVDLGAPMGSVGQLHVGYKAVGANPSDAAPVPPAPQCAGAGGKQ